MNTFKKDLIKRELKSASEEEVFEILEGIKYNTHFKKFIKLCIYEDKYYIDNNQPDSEIVKYSAFA